MALTCSMSVQHPGLVTQLLITAKMLNQLKMFDAVFIIPAKLSHPFPISSNYLSCSSCLGRAQILSFLVIRMQENQSCFGPSTNRCRAKAQIPSCIQAQTGVSLALCCALYLIHYFQDHCGVLKPHIIAGLEPRFCGIA